MITKVVEVEYKVDKIIIPGLLQMYLHDCFVWVYE